jgi:hypothetical protein
MTENYGEVRDIGDIPEDVADQYREMVCKVIDNHMEHFVAGDITDNRVDEYVVSAYRNHNRPLVNTSFNILF